MLCDIYQTLSHFFLATFITYFCFKLKFVNRTSLPYITFHTGTKQNVNISSECTAVQKVGFSGQLLFSI